MRTADLPDDDRAPARSEGLAPGALIGRFVVRARLGEGGMGVVYAAEDPDLQRTVAIKLVAPEVDRPALRARLLREAQAMARLDHPHVVRVLEVGEDRGRMFVAMELVDGQTLASWLGAGPRPWREIVAMFRQVGLGLAAIHRGGLVHRDIKPDNVLVDRGGRARVADLGLVRADRDEPGAASPALAATLTRTGIAMGTPGYMAPEQQRGERVDAFADQYSFCVALRDALLAARPAAPRALRAVLSRGLAFEPADRYPSLQALLAAIEHAAAARRRQVAIGGGATLVLGGVAAAIAVGVGASLAAPLEPVAVAGAAPDTAPAVASAPVDAWIPALPVDAGAPVVPVAAAREPTPREVARSTTPAPADAGVRLRPPPLVPPDADRGAPPPDAKTAPRSRVDPAHLSYVRDAIRDLGYRGFDLDDLDADLDAQEEATRKGRADTIAEHGEDHVMVGIADALLGIIKRREGDCAGARKIWKQALEELALQSQPGDRDQDQAYLWMGRVHFGRALCALAAGDLDATDKALDNAVMIGWGGGDRVELTDVDVARGIWFFERGDEGDGRRKVQNVGYTGDQRAVDAIDTYARGRGDL